MCICVLGIYYFLFINYSFPFDIDMKKYHVEGFCLFYFLVTTIVCFTILYNKYMKHINILGIYIYYRIYVNAYILCFWSSFLIVN